jgi:hypothetical protein
MQSLQEVQFRRFEYESQYLQEVDLWTALSCPNTSTATGMSKVLSDFHKLVQVMGSFNCEDHARVLKYSSAHIRQ